MKKMIARILIVAFMVGFCPMNTAAVQQSHEDALQTTIKACYTETVTDWYELAAVYAAEAKGQYENGVDLSAYKLPETPKSGATAVFVALMKGEEDAAKAAVVGLEAPASFAATQAMNLLALEAYGRGDPTFSYDKAGSIQVLLDFRNAEGGYGYSYGGTSYDDVDSAGMALTALSLYSDLDYKGLSAERDKLLQWIQTKQDIKPTTCNANTTAAVLWGLQAAKADTSAWTYDPLETLMSFYVEGGGFGFKDNKAINKFATKQAALALAEAVYGASFFANIRLNETQETKTVSIRVEGKTGQLLANKAFVTRKKAGLTVYDAVTQALDALQIPYKATGDYITEIGGQAEGQTTRYDGWSYLYNNQSPTVGMGATPIVDGDEITVYYGYALGYGMSLPKVAMQQTGRDVQLTLTDETQKPLSDVTILWDRVALVEKTDATGVVRIPAEKATAGQHTVQVEKVDADGVPQLVRLPEGYALTVTDSSVTPEERTVSVSVLGPNGSLYGKTEQTWSRTLTALDALRTTGLALILDGDYVKSIGGYAEFDYGANSGWKYRVNGVAPSVSAASYRLAKGDTLEWYYIRDYHTEDHGNSTPVTPTVRVKDGVARVQLTKGAIAAAVKNGELLIAPNLDEKVDTMSLTLPISAVAEQNAALTLKSEFGTVRFPRKAVADLSGEVTITMTRSQKVQPEPVGTREQVTLSVVSDGKEIGTFSDAITLMLPYQLRSGEVVGKLFMCEIDTAIHQKIGSEYREGGVVVESTHSSTYAVGYDARLKGTTSFTDITNQNASEIRYLEQRGIVKGSGDGQYVPTGYVTRGEFVTMLARIAGADTSDIDDTWFSDVSKDRYYAGAVNWAAREKIINGTGGGIFSADAPLTQKDMSTMLSRFAGIEEKDGTNFVTRAESAKILAEFLERRGATV